MLKNTIQSYGIVARIFHWLLVILILGMMVVGLTASDMSPGPEKAQVIGLHKSVGVIIILLVVLRLLWRLSNALPMDLGKNAFLNKIAHFSHFLLYVFMLAQPISGILMSQSFGVPVYVFGLFRLPMFVGKNSFFANLMLECHETIWVLLLIVIIIHAAAAFKHHFYDKDRTLMRMIKGT
jgi:cytochrome b561